MKAYLQFPLCVLSFGKTLDDRLNAILDFCVVETGVKLFSKLNIEQQRGFLAECYRSQKIPSGFTEKEPKHAAALYGAYILGVCYSHFRRIIKRYRLVDGYIYNFQTRYGRDAQVRIVVPWLLDTRDGSGITYREFCVLCAIYSAIGDKKMAVVTRDRIRRCALGYRTKAIMDAELQRREDKERPLTERQLRDTIARLHRNRFFARSTVSRRITYYSIRLGSEELRKKIFERRTYKNFFHSTESAMDAGLTAALTRAQSESGRDNIINHPLYSSVPNVSRWSN